ncbi:MAG: putative endonuclease, partial [Bacteroidetes bacterium]|nr:putative endonuclease [Bacteroidota bacterium]
MTKRAQAAWSQRGSRIAGILEGHFGIPLRSGKRSSPLNTLIATMLSQNTNDQNSYRAWLSMRKSFPTWEKVASAPWQALASSIKVGGLKNQKALRIKKILRLIHGETGKYDLGFLNDRSNDEVMEYLLSMKGV